MKNLFLLVVITTMCIVSSAQPIIQFTKTYGGILSESGNTIRQMPDHGYIIAGSTNSFGAGGHDIYLIRTDINGDTLWTKTFGGSGNDYLHWAMNNSLQITTDGGFIIFGNTNSYGAGGEDYYLIKTDVNGNLMWEKTFGGAAGEVSRAVQQTSDGGYVMCGLTFSNTVNANDCFIVKTDADGNLIWQKNYSINVWEGAESIQQTADGGYLFTGITSWHLPFLIKIDAAGNQEWLNYINVGQNGQGYSIEHTSDGGFIICGMTGSDSFLAKTDANGTILWTKVYVGPAYNGAYTVQQTPDGGYIFAGETNAFTGNGSYNMYVVKTNAVGDTLWMRIYGGASDEWAMSVQNTADGGYILLGLTASFGSGQSDAYLIKIIDIVQPGFITGKIYKDDNDNCTFETGTDGILVNRPVKAEPGPYYVFTDNNGNFNFKVPPGQYSVSLADVTNDFFGLQDCQVNNNYTVNVTSNTTSTGNSFAMKLLAPGDCVGSVNIVSAPFDTGSCTAPMTLSTPCPGSLHRYCVTITNTGTSVISPGSQLQVSLPPSMSYSSEFSNPCGLIFTPGPPLTWTVPNASILNDNGDYCEVCFDVNVAFIEPYTATATFNAQCGMDIAPLSTDLQIDADACSCDPNDKLVSPKGCGPSGNISKNENITYTVRFQNIGTGPAHNVVIKDSIDSDFDISTLQIISSSHTITALQIGPGNLLTISFENIELPPAITDQAGSNGYVRFSLLPVNNLPDGTGLTNSAAIYFDSNPPVVTNTTLNTLLDIPSPVANFSAQRQCASITGIYDFTYTGGTSDGTTFLWDFGADASPSASTEQNPLNILFGSSGTKNVTLTVFRYGCVSSISQTIDVINISCGNKGDKIQICHISPGNPGNKQLLCISPDALSAHLAHGDCVGTCTMPSAKKGNQSTDDNAKQINDIITETDSKFTIQPNPVNNAAVFNFSVQIQSEVLIGIYNCIGQNVAILFNDYAESERQYSLPFNFQLLPEGIYFGIMKSDSETKILKIAVVK